MLILSNQSKKSTYMYYFKIKLTFSHNGFGKIKQKKWNSAGLGTYTLVFA